MRPTSNAVLRTLLSCFFNDYDSVQNGKYFVNFLYIEEPVLGQLHL